MDKYLWAVRVFKTRSDAADAVRNNKVTVNGAYAKPSREVKIGDVIEIAFGQRTLKVEVTAVTENATKADAPAMYKELP